MGQSVLESSNYDIETEEIRFLASAYDSNKRRNHVAFSSKLESEFQQYYARAFVSHRRLALWALLVFVFLMCVVDLSVFRDAWMTVALVKNAGMAAFSGCLVLIATSKQFERYQYIVLVSMLSVLACVQAWSMLHLPDAFYVHYVPLFLVLTLIASVFMRIPMKYFVWGAVVTWFAFNFVVVLVDPRPTPTQVAYNVYFIFASVLGASLLRILEQTTRKEYIKSRLISVEKKELERVSRQLGQLDNVDPVTGLSNMKHFNKSLGVEWYRAIRNGKELTVLLIEIDRLEGHGVTFEQRLVETYLFKVAKALNDSFKRAADLVAIGEDKRFVVMLPEVGQDTAKILCERVKARVAELALHYPETEDPITVTVGQVTCVPGAQEDMSDLLAMATQGLHQARLRGENAHAVYVSNPTPLEGGA